MTKIVMAIDPGLTTGYIISDGPFATNVFSVGEVQDFPALRVLLETYTPHIVVCESYRVYPWKAREQSFSNVPSAEIIGAIKDWCLSYDVQYIEQGAGKAKILNNRTIKALGLWDITKNYRHARDAARHLIVYYMEDNEQLKKIGAALFKKEGVN